jgi:hypothetical protein
VLLRDGVSFDPNDAYLVGLPGDSAISQSMADEWDDVLKTIESLKQDMRRIADAITLTASDLDHIGSFGKSTVRSR